MPTASRDRSLGTLAQKYMTILSIAITLACFVFWILGIQTETHRIVMAMVASLVILIASSFSIPAVTSTLVSGGPARNAQGEFIKDADGGYLFSQKYMRSYQSAEGEMISIIYFSGSILGAGFLLLGYRFLRSGSIVYSNLKAIGQNDENKNG